MLLCKKKDVWWFFCLKIFGVKFGLSFIMLETRACDQELYGYVTDLAIDYLNLLDREKGIKFRANQRRMK